MNIQICILRLGAFYISTKKIETLDAILDYLSFARDISKSKKTVPLCVLRQYSYCFIGSLKSITSKHQNIDQILKLPDRH